MGTLRMMHRPLLLFLCLTLGSTRLPAADGLRLNDLGYLEMPGLNVLLALDQYAEGHQGGLTLIQHGRRVASNGDLRLDRTPGQWQPTPALGTPSADPATGELRVHGHFPDPAKNRTGFNPIEYPDFNFGYTVRVVPQGAAFDLVVDFDSPLPAAWAGRVGFILELFPGDLFGRSFATEQATGTFPRHPAGPGRPPTAGEELPLPLATGRRLVIAPESDELRLTIEDQTGGQLELLDGRVPHPNGWFLVRSAPPAGAQTAAIHWRLTPHTLPGWRAPPVLQLSQVGYHPDQVKWAVLELDPHDPGPDPIVLSRIHADGTREIITEGAGEDLGRFLRSHYRRLDFTAVRTPGLYQVTCGAARSSPFRIATAVFTQGVWQPTLEYFLPVQMCHMRVNDRYRVWHGACHLDDARMAPVNHHHFDGYQQGASTLCAYAPGQPVPGLATGGWHDAGDDDLRIESQAATVHGLALAYECFALNHDSTTIDPANRVVELLQPDGQPDVLQQIEHGLRSVVGGRQALGRFYRGIIVPSLRQYTHLGEFSSQTDNVPFDPARAPPAPPPIDAGRVGSPDDRWVFTEHNPARDLETATALAAAARVLRPTRAPLAETCLALAVEVWEQTTKPPSPSAALWAGQVHLAVELLLTTREPRYAAFLLSHRNRLATSIREAAGNRHAPRLAAPLGRVLALVDDATFTREITAAAQVYRDQLAAAERRTPYGVDYTPHLWGGGWGVQRYGVEQYFLHRGFPNLFPRDGVLHALDFVLGCHPGPNNSSFISGVGARSALVAYGSNRADWSHIPGGSISGTALIQPDYPELREWPFLWQQTEYVLGGGTTDYLFLVLAADRLLNPPAP